MHISIDDFGTGYSSFSYLKQLPVECLKIDRAFVDGLDKSTESAAIVKAVIAWSTLWDWSVSPKGLRRRRVRSCEISDAPWPRASSSAGPCPPRLLGPYPTDDLQSWYEADAAEAGDAKATPESAPEG